MRGVCIALPLVFLTTLVACQSGDDSRVANDPVSPSAPEIGPNLGAEVFRNTVDFFLLWDSDRNYSATIGLVSPVADLDENPDCGGRGPRVVDGGIQELVLTPAGSEHFSESYQKATFVMYDGVTGDVCDLSDPATHPVVAQGEVNFRNTLRIATDGVWHFHFQMTGIVDLTSGGEAAVLVSASALYDNDGNPTIHVDKFELKPIGR
jgi:hypothetical protein